MPISFAHRRVLQGLENDSVSAVPVMGPCRPALDPWNSRGKIVKTLITVAHTYNPNVRSAATGRSLGLTVQPAWQVLGY